jgi:hypothetical protein
MRLQFLYILMLIFEMLNSCKIVFLICGAPNFAESMGGLPSIGLTIQAGHLRSGGRSWEHIAVRNIWVPLHLLRLVSLCAPLTPSPELPSPPLAPFCVCVCVSRHQDNAAGGVLICHTQRVAVVTNTLTFLHEIISLFSD